VIGLALPPELQSILSQNGGTVTTAQANTVGVSNERLRLLVKAGELERVTFGIYVSPDEFVDKMYVVQLRRPKVIYSHETALFLHDLTDRDPVSYTVTVPTGYNAKNLREDGFTVFTIKRELHGLGTTELTTMFGHTVTAYNLETVLRREVRDRRHPWCHQHPHEGLLRHLYPHHHADLRCGYVQDGSEKDGREARNF
jgi:predicted transcriptional regulator of viral defense system